MAAEQIVETVVDRAIEAEASAVLAEQGMTVPDAVRRLLAHVASEKALPIELLAPNAETLAAMDEARQGGLPRFSSVGALLDDLNADD